MAVFSLCVILNNIHTNDLACGYRLPIYLLKGIIYDND